MKISTIRPEFVEFVPKELAEGVLYISERYKTASHKCACGCGEKVVTPLSSADWQLSKDADGLVTLFPSIGNWSHPCRSHYWIRKNQIQWARSMSARQIEAVKQRDRIDKARYIDQVNRKKDERDVVQSNSEPSGHPRESGSLWDGFVSGVLRFIGLK